MLNLKGLAGRYQPFKLGVRVYNLPALMVLLGVASIVSLAYSAHGGPAWLALPLTFPYVLVRLGRAYFRADPSDRPRIRRFAIASLAPAAQR